MPRTGTKFRMYADLMNEAPSILEEARKAAHELGLGPLQPLPGSPAQGSGATERPFDKALSALREVIKDAYGDGYDCFPASSPTAARRIACQAAFLRGRCGRYSSSGHMQAPAARLLSTPQRLRLLVPRQKRSFMPPGFEPFPPKYRHVAGAAETPGTGEEQTSVEQADADAVIVPLAGASYPFHGVSSTPVSMLASSNFDASIEAVAAAAEVHAASLCGVFALGSATPGCGFGQRDERDVHILPAGLRELAAEFDVPCVIDDPCGLPFVERTPDTPGTALEVYGHPALGGLGLIIGTEDLVTPLVKGLLGRAQSGAEFHDEWGESLAPPTASTLATLLDLVSDLRDDPDRYTHAVDRLYDIVTAELGGLDSRFKQAVRIRKEYGALAVEVNYEDTWRDGMGFPIFTIEDSRAGTNLLEAAIAAMGISRAGVLEASVLIRVPAPGPGRFELDTERIGLEMRGLAKLMELLAKRSGYLT